MGRFSDSITQNKSKKQQVCNNMKSIINVMNIPSKGEEIPHEIFMYKLKNSSFQEMSKQMFLTDRINSLTMDANQSLAEYHVRWTIRHEFGHTLGFPDCYVEFYDTSTQEMISYQVDTSNLMCSRRGKLQEKHYNELKRVYYTP